MTDNFGGHNKMTLITTQQGLEDKLTENGADLARIKSLNLSLEQDRIELERILRPYRENHRGLKDEEGNLFFRFSEGYDERILHDYSLFFMYHRESIKGAETAQEFPERRRLLSGDIVHHQSEIAYYAHHFLRFVFPEEHNQYFKKESEKANDLNAMIGQFYRLNGILYDCLATLPNSIVINGLLYRIDRGMTTETERASVSHLFEKITELTEKTSDLFYLYVQGYFRRKINPASFELDNEQHIRYEKVLDEAYKFEFALKEKMLEACEKERTTGIRAGQSTNSQQIITLCQESLPYINNLSSMVDVYLENMRRLSK